MVFSEFRPLNEESLIEYIKATPALSSRLANIFDGLKIQEVGDGNLNFVYIVVGSAGSMVIKQVSFSFGCLEINAIFNLVYVSILILELVLVTTTVLQFF